MLINNWHWDILCFIELGRKQWRNNRSFMTWCLSRWERRERRVRSQRWLWYFEDQWWDYGHAYKSRSGRLSKGPCSRECLQSAGMHALHSFWAQNRTPVAAPLLLCVSRDYCSGQCGWAEMQLWARVFKIKVYFLFTAFSWPRWPRAEWPGSHLLKMESTTLGTEPSAKWSSCPGWLPIPDSNTRNTLGHLVKAA